MVKERHVPLALLITGGVLFLCAFQVSLSSTHNGLSDFVGWFALATGLWLVLVAGIIFLRQRRQRPADGTPQERA